MLSNFIKIKQYNTFEDHFDSFGFFETFNMLFIFQFFRKLSFSDNYLKNKYVKKLIKNK
jgi:hypothetical protein